MRTIGPFEIHEPLTRGGSATVHVARWAADGGVADTEPIVAKVAHAGFELALHAENDALRAVEHPNVVAPVGFVDDMTSVALVLPRAACSLTAHAGRLSDGQTAPMLGALAAALAQLHRAGVAHGDIRPANVLLFADGTPALTDFGRASPVTAAGAAADVAALARTGLEVLASGPPSELRTLLTDVAADPCDALAFGECLDALGIDAVPIDVTSVRPVVVEPPTTVVD